MKVIVSSCYCFAMVQAKCPNVGAEELFPCLCFQDTGDIFCRSQDGRSFDDESMERIFKMIKSKSSSSSSSSSNDGNGLSFGKLTLTQTDITNIPESIFSGMTFTEIVIRYNFKLRSLHERSFESSKDVTRNISFGEVGSFYDMANIGPISLNFLKTFTQLDNIFLNALNIGHFDQDIFKPLITGSKKAKLYLNSLLIDCNCKNKWLYEQSVPDRNLILNPNLSGIPKDLINPVSCRHPRIGSIVPMRALSIFDFTNCS